MRPWPSSTPVFVASRVRADLTVDQRTTLEEVRDRLASARDRLSRVLADGASEAHAAGWARAINVAAIYRTRNTPAAPAPSATARAAIRQALTEDECTELETAKAEVGRALTDVRQLLSDGDGDPAPENRRSTAPLVSKPYSTKRR
jgi:hypothetical protein